MTNQKIKLYNLLHKGIKQANKEDKTLYLVVLPQNNFYIAQNLNYKAIYNYEIIGDSKNRDLDEAVEECFNDLVYQLSYF